MTWFDGSDRMGAAFEGFSLKRVIVRYFSQGSFPTSNRGAGTRKMAAVTPPPLENGHRDGETRTKGSAKGSFYPPVTSPQYLHFLQA